MPRFEASLPISELKEWTPPVDPLEPLRQQCREFVSAHIDFEPLNSHFSIFIPDGGNVEFGTVGTDRTAIVSAVLLRFDKGMQGRAEVIGIVKLSIVQEWIENGRN